jgi:hypothetical protein
MARIDPSIAHFGACVTGGLMRTRLAIRSGIWPGAALAFVIAATPAARARSGQPAEKGAVDPDGASASYQESGSSPRAGGLRMSRAVVCRTIDGYEQYTPLPGAAQTSDEKLLIYYRPQRYKIDFVDDYYTAHLVQDNEIRKKGKKEIVRQKKKVVEYQPKQKQPLGPFYIRNTISLKGLDPGDYELTIILRDELDTGTPPSKQVVKFKVIPATDLKKAASKKAGDRPPGG